MHSGAAAEQDQAALMQETPPMAAVRPTPALFLGASAVVLLDGSAPRARPETAPRRPGLPGAVAVAIRGLARPASPRTLAAVAP